MPGAVAPGAVVAWAAAGRAAMAAPAVKSKKISKQNPEETVRRLLPAEDSVAGRLSIDGRRRLIVGGNSTMSILSGRFCRQ